MARKKPQEPPPLEIRELSPPQIDRAIEKLRKRIEEVKALDPERIADPANSEASPVESNIRTTIFEVFGEYSPEFREHEHLWLFAGPSSVNMSREAIVAGKRAGMEAAIGILEGLIARLEERREDLGLDPARTAFEGLDLHPRIAEAAADLYRSGHYPEAVFAAAKAIIYYVKERSGRDDLDGANLMRTVFSKKDPILAVNDLSDQTDQDEQEGTMQLFVGAVLALKNLGSHAFPENSPEQALEHVAFLSMLANRVAAAKRMKRG